MDHQNAFHPEVLTNGSDQNTSSSPKKRKLNAQEILEIPKNEQSSTLRDVIENPDNHFFQFKR